MFSGSYGIEGLTMEILFLRRMVSPDMASKNGLVGIETLLL